MVEYPDLSTLNNGSGIAGLLQIPIDGYPFYWLWMLVSIWIIMFLSLYFVEKDKVGKGKILSSMAVSCLGILILGVIGTILGIITVEIMVYILVFSLIILGIWFYSGKD